MRRLLPILVVLIACTVEAQTVKPVKKLFVYDATGRKVGGVQGFDEQLLIATIAVKLDGRVLTLQATKQKLMGADERFIVFQSPDCTGQPLIDAQPLNIMVPVVTVIGPTRTVYRGDGSAPTLLTYDSRLDLTTGGCVVENSTGQLIPAQIVGNLSTFSPPFTAR
jgi:hypothetical protein